jgi:hypothetical protein
LSIGSLYGLECSQTIVMFSCCACAELMFSEQETCVVHLHKDVLSTWPLRGCKCFSFQFTHVNCRCRMRLQSLASQFCKCSNMLSVLKCSEIFSNVLYLPLRLKLGSNPTVQPHSRKGCHGMDPGVDTLLWMQQYLSNIGNTLLTARDQAHVPSTPSLITAVLIFALCGNAALAEYYLISVARRNGHRNQSVHVPHLDLAFIQTLLNVPRIGRSVSRGFHNLSNKYRLQADKFLMNSLLADYVIQQNLKGVVITADTAIAQYLKLWCHRPVAEQTRTWLLKLTHKVCTRKRFGRCFRSEWALQFGALKVKKSLDEEATRRKVCLLVR